MARNKYPSRLLMLQWIFVIFLFFTGLYYFCTAFLFIKTSIPNTPSSIPPLSTKHPFSKFIILIIDALRFDFVIPNSQTKNLPHLSILQKLLHKYPKQSLLYKFVADAPTTTSQRLKALVTGNLPSFIEAGKNFNSDELMESNWLEYVSQSGNYSIQILGDDTWLQLFPFSKDSVWKNQNQSNSHFFPSFDVWDLHTVDNGILEYWNSTLEQIHSRQNQKSITIGHFLGVDHAGHRYGVFHEQMHAKVQQMNQIIEQTIDLMDENTLLMVMGDHGMNDFGDHGGDSPLEVESALFFFSKTFALRSSNNISNDLIPPTIPQIDLVPTISFLTGTELPRQNLGKVLIDLFDTIFIDECTELHSYPNYHIFKSALLLHINAKQVTDYLLQLPHIPLYKILQAENLDPLHIHPDTKFLFTFLNTSDTQRKCAKLKQILDDEQLSTLLVSITQYHEQYLSLISCKIRQLWSNPNLVLMVFGILIMITSCVVAVVHLVNPLWNTFYSIPTSLIGFVVLLVLFCWNVLFPNQLITIIHVSVTLFCGFLITLFELDYIHINRSIIQYTSPPLLRFDILLPIFLLFLQFVSVFSNSFVLFEDRIVYYFVVTCVIAIIFHILCNDKYTKIRFVLLPILFFILICIKLSIHTIRFRTHGTHIIAESFPGSNSSTFYVAYAIVGLLFCCQLQYEFFESESKQLQNYLSYYSVLQSIFITTFWCGYYMHESIFSTSVFQVWIPRFVYGIAIIFPFLIPKRNTKYWFLILFYPMVILKGYSYLISCILFMLQIFLFDFIQLTNQLHIIYQLFMYWCIGNQFYFSLGQQNTFNTIQWLSAFIGVENANIILSGFLVVFNTLAPRLIMTVEAGMLISNTYGYQSKSRYLMLYWLWNALMVIFSVSCVHIHAKHLMVWAIFAPKFIFDSISLVATSIIVLLFLLKYKKD